MYEYFFYYIVSRAESSEFYTVTFYIFIHEFSVRVDKL